MRYSQTSRPLLGRYSHRDGRRVVLPIAGLTLACVLLLTAMSGCGAAPIERLHGEPKGGEKYTRVRPSTPPVADAVNRFIAAIRRGAFEEANELLSRGTRMALEVRARTIGLRGVDLLRAPGAKVSVHNQRLFVRDPIATFTLQKLRKIRVGERPWPVNKPHDGSSLRWLVELVDASGRRRMIKLRFEGINWRIHNPRLLSR